MSHFDGECPMKFESLVFPERYSKYRKKIEHLYRNRLYLEQYSLILFSFLFWSRDKFRFIMALLLTPSFICFGFDFRFLSSISLVPRRSDTELPGGALDNAYAEETSSG